MCRAGPDYRLGDQPLRIAIIGSCPGKSEEEQGRPFIGDAGKNLADMVAIINGINPASFPSPNRDDYTLLNAHALPRYQIRGQPKVRTEPTRLQVLDDNNVARLIRQIRGADITRVLLAGGTAQFLTQTLIDKLPDLELYSCGHPSQRRWNLFYKGRPQEEKLNRWTHDTFQMV